MSGACASRTNVGTHQMRQLQRRRPSLTSGMYIPGSTARGHHQRITHAENRKTNDAARTYYFCMPDLTQACTRAHDPQEHAHVPRSPSSMQGSTRVYAPHTHPHTTTHTTETRGSLVKTSPGDSTLVRGIAGQSCTSMPRKWPMEWGQNRLCAPLSKSSLTCPCACLIQPRTSQQQQQQRRRRRRRGGSACSASAAAHVQQADLHEAVNQEPD